MEALSIGCRSVEINTALDSRAEQPAPQQPGILRDNQLIKSKFDKMISDQCLFLQPMLSASILN